MRQTATQCMDVTSGAKGSFFYDDGAPFVATSPVFPDLVGLYTWERNAKKTVAATLTYKTKVKEFADNGGRYIDYKKSYSRHECNLRPCDHSLYNSDLFPSVLNRAARAAQQNKEWCRLEDLPAGITLDTSKFLAVVTVRIEI